MKIVIAILVAALVFVGCSPDTPRTSDGNINLPCGQKLFAFSAHGVLVFRPFRVGEEPETYVVSSTIEGQRSLIRESRCR